MLPVGEESATGCGTWRGRGLRVWPEESKNGEQFGAGLQDGVGPSQLEGGLQKVELGDESGTTSCGKVES